MASISFRQQNNTNLETMIQVVGGGGGGTVSKVLSPYSLHHHYHNHLNHQPFHIFQKTNAHTSLSISSTSIELSGQNLQPKNIGHSVTKNSDANINVGQLPIPKVSAENIGDNASATSSRFLGKANRYNCYHYDLLPEKIFDTDDEDDEDEDDEYIYHDGKDDLTFSNYHSKQKQKLVEGSPEPKSNMEKGGSSVISPDKFSSSSDNDPKAQTNQFSDNLDRQFKPPEKVQSENQLKNMINQGKLVNSHQVFDVSPVNLNVDKKTSFNKVVLPQMAKWDSVGETSNLTIIRCSNVPSSRPDEKVSQILPVITVKKIKLIPLSVQNFTADNKNNNNNNNNNKPKSLNKKFKNDKKKRLTKNQRLESCQKLRKKIWLQLLKDIQSRKDVISLNGQERRLRSQNVAVQCQQWTMHNRLKHH